MFLFFFVFISFVCFLTDIYIYLSLKRELEILRKTKAQSEKEKFEQSQNNLLKAQKLDQQFLLQTHYTKELE